MSRDSEIPLPVYLIRTCAWNGGYVNSLMIFMYVDILLVNAVFPWKINK